MRGTRVPRLLGVDEGGGSSGGGGGGGTGAGKSPRRRMFRAALLPFYVLGIGGGLWLAVNSPYLVRSPLTSHTIATRKPRPKINIPKIRIRPRVYNWETSPSQRVGGITSLAFSEYDDDDRNGDERNTKSYSASKNSKAAAEAAAEATAADFSAMDEFVDAYGELDLNSARTTGKGKIRLTAMEVALAKQKDSVARLVHQPNGETILYYDGYTGPYATFPLGWKFGQEPAPRDGGLEAIRKAKPMVLDEFGNSKDSRNRDWWKKRGRGSARPPAREVAGIVAKRLMSRMHPLVREGLLGDMAPFLDARIGIKSMRGFVKGFSAHASLVKVHNGSVVHVGGTLPFVNWALQHFSAALAKVAAEIAPLQLPPIYMLLNPMDEPMAEGECEQKSLMSRLHGLFTKYPEGDAKGLDLPIWSTTKVPACHKDILFPFSDFWGAVGRFNASWQVPWPKKLDVAMWRGCPTGHGNNMTNQRVRLVRYVRHYQSHTRDRNPVKFNVGLHEVCQNFYGSELVRKLVIGRIPFKNFTRYRYILDIDGNSYSRRLPDLLETGAVVVRMGFFTDIMLRAMESKKHYVRVSMAFDDLVEKIQWLRRISPRGKGIAEDARKFHRDHFNDDSLMDYVRASVLLYASSVEFLE